MTDRADVVRKVLAKQRSEADEVRDNLRMTKENMMEAKRKSKEVSSWTLSAPVSTCLVAYPSFSIN